MSTDPRSTLRLVPTLALAALAAGCAGPLNNESSIGNHQRPFNRGVWTPPALTDMTPATPPEGLEATTDQQSAPVYGPAGPVAANVAQPSIVSLDRSNWAETPMDVPSDMAAHQPTFYKNVIIKDSNPRAQGKFPDERTALGLGTHRHNDEQALEALAAPFAAATDIVLLVPRAIVESRPRQPTRTGGEPYQRWPSHVTIINPPAETSAAPAPAGVVPPEPTPRTPAYPQPGGPIRSRTTPQEPPAPRREPPAPRVEPAPAPQPAPSTGRPAQPQEELRPGGGMPASDHPTPQHQSP